MLKAVKDYYTIGTIGRMIDEWTANRYIDLKAIPDKESYWFEVMWHPEVMCDLYKCSDCPLKALCSPDVLEALKESKIFGKVYFAFIQDRPERYRDLVDELLGKLMELHDKYKSEGQ